MNRRRTGGDLLGGADGHGGLEDLVRAIEIVARFERGVEERLDKPL